MSKMDTSELERALAELLGSSSELQDGQDEGRLGGEEFFERLRACEDEANAAS